MERCMSCTGQAGKPDRTHMKWRNWQDVTPLHSQKSRERKREGSWIVLEICIDSRQLPTVCSSFGCFFSIWGLILETLGRRNNPMDRPWAFFKKHIHWIPLILRYACYDLVSPIVFPHLPRSTITYRRTPMNSWVTLRRPLLVAKVSFDGTHPGGPRLQLWKILAPWLMSKDLMQLPIWEHRTWAKRWHDV